MIAEAATEIQYVGYNHFFDKLNDKKHTFLLGDFNVDLIKTDSSSETSNYFDIMFSEPSVSWSRGVLKALHWGG